MSGVKDIAAAMLYAVSQPPRVNVNILTLYPSSRKPTARPQSRSIAPFGSW
jgi:NADP-dependent 3-hydroxy acid dehydrogenase YdfG